MRLLYFITFTELWISIHMRSPFNRHAQFSSIGILFTVRKLLIEHFPQKHLFEENKKKKKMAENIKEHSRNTHSHADHRVPF